jgi:ElaB/YqjD/DUF883 family membrane-anchored ribosome-binding protein
VGATPDQLKADIEKTRAELASDVDSLTDRVNPANVARRQAGALRSSVTGVKERVMGSASNATSSVSGSASSVTGTVQQAPDALRSRTEGNPLAMGLIAFGAGMLASTLIPTTTREEQLAVQAKDAVAEPIQSTVKDSAQQIAEELKPAAQDAVEQVKQTATSAAQTTTEEAKSSAGDVASTAKDSAQETKAAAQQSS